MRRFRLLLVDDEVEVLRALERTFRSEGYDLYTATDAEGAIEILEAEEIDMIISDQRMPDMLGTDLLKTVQRRYPWILRMVLTGYADARLAREAFEEAGACKVLAKPWDNNHLRAIVRGACMLLDVKTAREPEETLAFHTVNDEVAAAFPRIRKAGRDRGDLLRLAPPPGKKRS